MFNLLRQSTQRLAQRVPRTAPRSGHDKGLLATMVTMGCMAGVQFSSRAQCQEPTQVCPVKHTTPSESDVCPVSIKPSSSNNTSQSNPGVCPVQHAPKQSQTVTESASPTVGVCPVKHTSTTSSTTPSETPSKLSDTGSVCPVKAGSQGSEKDFIRMATKARPAPAEAVTSGTHGSFEPRDTDSERYVAPYDPAKAQAEEDATQGAFGGIHNAHVIPGGRIPATGRGNSSDGADWVNPTPAELFRALRRKNKPIEEEDAWSVAFVHSVVVDQTWAQILEYEELHKDECTEPTLAAFEGKYGDHTIKTKILNMFYPSMIPFDRHDWYVDRCGKRVRYIIDYYAVEDPDGSETYTVDARPEPTFAGIRDRAIIAAKRWWRGDSVW